VHVRARAGGARAVRPRVHVPQVQPPPPPLPHLPHHRRAPPEAVHWTLNFTNGEKVSLPSLSLRHETEDKIYQTCSDTPPHTGKIMYM
jgi:hypothetical protein